MSKATIETASTPAEAEQTIRAAAQRIVDIVDSQGDMQTDWPYPAEHGILISQCLLEVLRIPDNEVPVNSRRLWNACAELAKKHADVMNGVPESTTALGWPRMSYSVAVGDIRHALKVKPKTRVALRPVAELLAEFGDDNRRHLYVSKEYSYFNSDTGELEGPFHRRGTVQPQLIEKEAKEPGSVVPAGWHPDDGRVESILPLVEVSNKVRSIILTCVEDAGRKPKAVAEDPLTVAELLWQGQFVPVIARIKGVTEAEVRRVAAEIGAKPTYASDAYANADIHSQSEGVYRLNMLGDWTEFPSVSTAAAPSSPAEVPGEAEQDSSDGDDPELTLDDALRGMLEQNPDTDTLNALRALKSRGIVASGAAVGPRLAELRRDMTAAAGS